MTMATQHKKDIKYYLNLGWTYTVETERDEGDNFIYINSC